MANVQIGGVTTNYLEINVMFLHSRPRLFWVTIAASLFFLNCNQVRSPEESETNGLLSDTFADQTLIDNSVSRCALGLGSGAVESVTGFFDFLKGLWTAAKYIIETDIDGLMLLHWNETFREIARERLAEKGAKQRELVTNLVSVAYNAVPLTRQYLNQEYSWYDSLPAHHQSEFLCKVLILKSLWKYFIFFLNLWEMLLLFPQLL